MVVMIVRYCDDVDRRQLVESYARSNPALRTGKLYGRCARTPNRIEENIESGHLQQKTAVPYPRQRRSVRRPSRLDELGSGQCKGRRIRVWPARIAATFDECPLEKVAEAMEL